MRFLLGRTVVGSRDVLSWDPGAYEACKNPESLVLCTIQSLYIYVSEFHENDSATRILAPILTDLRFCTRLVGFGTQVRVALLWAGTQLYKQEYICIEQQEAVKKYAK